MRILKLVSSCGKCDNKQYDTGGAYRCGLVDEPIRDQARVAAFCPLAPYPSNAIAGLEATVQSLREGNSHSFHYAIFSFMAAKLKAKLTGSGHSIHLLVKGDNGNDEDFYIPIHNITGVDFGLSAVNFVVGQPQKKYILFLGHECVLHEVVNKEGDKELTRRVFFCPA